MASGNNNATNGTNGVVYNFDQTTRIPPNEPVDDIHYPHGTSKQVFLLLQMF